MSTTRMNHPEERPKPLAPGRRLYRSTYVFLAFAILVVLLLNLPGQYVLDVDFSSGKYGPHFGIYVQHCEHGWPFTFLRREEVELNAPPWWRLSLWNLAEGVEQFNLSALIANSVVGVAVVLVSGLLFEARRRRRKRLLQFDLRELLILVTVVSVCAAALAVQRSQYRDEQNILKAIEEASRQNVDWAEYDVAERIGWSFDGPTWMRQLVGDQMFTVFDRVIRIDTNGEGLKHVVELSHLKVICIGCPITKGQLRLLEQSPQLEALDMSFVYLVDADGHSGEGDFSLPKLPNLRGLNLYDASFGGDGLENIPSIEVLDLSGTSVDDESVPVLVTLTKLRILVLGGTDISDSGREQLHRALPNCEILDVMYERSTGS